MAENFAASASIDNVPLDRWPGIAAVAVIVAVVMLLSPHPTPTGVPPATAPLPRTQPAPAMAAAPAAPTPAPGRRRPSAPAVRWNAPPAVTALADGVLTRADHEDRAFVIIDKRHARLYAVDAAGRLIGDAPVLLGAARGDDSVPGIGERPIALIRPFERTTPAGRFAAAAGLNAHGEDIVWVDYDNAISMHRVRAVNPKERRLQRLASPSAADNRISYGCINMPAAFFDRVIAPMFRDGEHAVYVLPEVKPVRQVFAFVHGTPVASRRHESRTASSD